MLNLLQVFSSFIAQSGIAVIALAALLAFELWNPVIMSAAEAPADSHANRLSVAIVEFHKAQSVHLSLPLTPEVSDIDLKKQR